MRDYFENTAEKSQKKTIVRLLISIGIAAVVMTVLMFLMSLIVLNTGVPEKSESIIMIIISAIGSVLLTVLFTRALDSKGIFCSVYAFIVMMLFKFLLTIAISGGIHFGRQGIVGVIFTAVFCIIGGILGSNMKK